LVHFEDLETSGDARSGRARSNDLAERLPPWLPTWLPPWLSFLSQSMTFIKVLILWP